MFDSIKDALKKANEERIRAAEEEARRNAARDYAKNQQEREKEAREIAIAKIRIITGEVKYRYAILDTLRVFAHYMAEAGTPYDPTAATELAARQMQELAFSRGADAVIHAQYQILRHTTTRRNYADVPVYEAHLFGTAIKIIGPPVDWQNE